MMAKSYGIKGFAIYYYWFSNNSITGKNQIFEKVIDKFFAEELDDFDVFFIYCNENWYNNVAFNCQQVENYYTTENIRKNVDLLLTKYFCHNNYKKINNKPLFLIHHPWEMTEDELKMFYKVSNEMCKEKGFDGINLVTNCIQGVHVDFDNYYHHINYKSKYQPLFMYNKVIDYGKYVYKFLEHESHIDNYAIINSIFNKFDNSVRFFHHENKDQHVTKTCNDRISIFEDFLEIQFKKYKNNKNDITKIFLINSWNEWGEQMTMEPSNEENFVYLETFMKKLLDNFK